MNPPSNTLHIGTVGFSYETWANGLFYPSNLPRSEWLAYYSQHFSCVEIAHSFSKVPDKDTFQSWHDQTGPAFKFSLRGNQYLTHVKKLKGVGEPLKLFMEPALKLREKLACIVWEIPKLGRDQNKLLEAFSKHLKKYPKVRQFFDFGPEASFDQTTLQILNEAGHEVIAKPPRDSITENLHYFRISLDQEGPYQEWEADLLQRFSMGAGDHLGPHFMIFDGPQAASSVKRARSFMEKMASATGKAS